MAKLSYDPFAPPKYGREDIICPHCWYTNIWFFVGPSNGCIALCHNCHQEMTIWPPKGWEAETVDKADLYKLTLPGE